MSGQYLPSWFEFYVSFWRAIKPPRDFMAASNLEGAGIDDREYTCRGG
jgi:hypothetical protein